jgi:CDP-6-deoxy-D-xylo-4-hexulose-3-dehydrase
MRVPLASTGLKSEQIEDAIAVLRSGNLTMGQRVLEFETAMAGYLEVDHFVMVNSGSSANLAIVEALLRPTRGAPRLAAGDEVLVPAIAWPTTVWPVLQLGLKARFVDIRKDTLSIDLRKAQKIVDENRNVKAIFPIHPLGFGIPGEELEQFAASNRLVLINDVCESLGSWSNGVHAGTNGLASSFSFYFSHHITTMEGGGVATNDAEIADDLRAIRSHGWSRDRSDSESWHDELSPTDRKFTFVSTGFNIRPMEIQAAIGMSEVRKISQYVERRREIAEHVWQVLKPTGLNVIGHELLTGANASSHSWMHIPIEVPPEEFVKDRLIQELESRGVDTRPVLTGNFLQQPSAKRYLAFSEAPESFVEANEISANSFLVGCHHDLTEGQVNHLLESLSESADLARR